MIDLPPSRVLAPKIFIQHILVVEDSPTQALSLKALLEIEGFKVSLVNDGPDAIEQAQERSTTAEPVDLIVLDVELPTLSGYETCRRLKANPATASIPVIMFTSRDRPADTLAGLETGIVDYIPKDAFAQPTLLHTIRRLNGGNYL